MARLFPAVNCCIYCGVTDVPLSDEHIIPEGLNGDLVLPKASCQKCARITSRDELRFLRNSVREARALLGYKSRRKKQRPKDTLMEFVRGNSREVRRIPLVDAVVPVPMPVLRQPGCLRVPQDDGQLQSSGVQVIAVGQDPAKVVLDNTADSFSVLAHVDVPAFARMIAKIAYSYSAAKLGYERVRHSLLLPSLLGENGDIGMWVGGDDRLIGKPDHAGHNIAHMMFKAPGNGGDVEIAIVVLRLFSHLGAPGYVIVLSPNLLTLPHPLTIP